MNKYNDWLECQNCGIGVRLLDAQEKWNVAHNPYNYIVFCSTCLKEKSHIEKGYNW